MKLAVMTQNTALFQLISRCFEPDGATCTRFSDDMAFARAVYRDEFSAILIDAETGMNPMRPVFARRSCYADRRAPLIVVGAREDRSTIAHLFDAGADDVVLFPVNAYELTLRVHLALRRHQPAQPGTDGDRLSCGRYMLDRRTCTVWIDEEAVRLTSREFAIVWLLCTTPGEYVSRRQIAGAVWSSAEDIVGRSLEQHIYKLRKKLKLDGSHGMRLRTMYAHGYRVELDDEHGASIAPPAQTHAAANAATLAGHALAAAAAVGYGYSYGYASHAPLGVSIASGVPHLSDAQVRAVSADAARLSRAWQAPVLEGEAVFRSTARAADHGRSEHSRGEHVRMVACPLPSAG